MFGTIYKSYSGILANTLGLNVTSNNLSNINTVGYKRSSAEFAQIMTNLTRPSAGNGNPTQFGLGAKNTQIVNQFSQGAIKTSGTNTHMALLGQGFFVTADGAGDLHYTRAGNFQFSNEEVNGTQIGRLVAADGSVVQGYIDHDANGNIDLNGTVGDIEINYEEQSPPRVTTEVRFITNLSATAEPGETYTTVMDIWDTAGNSYPLTLNFQKTTNTGEWRYSFGAGADVVVDAEGTGLVQFDENGILSTVDGLPFSDPAIQNKTITLSGLEDGSTLPILWDVVNTDGDEAIPHFTNFSSYSTTGAQYQDGFGTGELQNITFLQDGTMMGFYTNGDSVPLAKVAVAQFTNLNGLKQTAGGFFQETAASGEATLRNDGTTSIRGNALEAANVDIAEEFTGLIVHQRGFQGNSKAVSMADQVLQEILGLKR